jgi:hypothetical protein
MDLGDVRIYHGGKYKINRDAKVGLLNHVIK